MIMNRFSRILNVFRMAITFWRCGPVNAWRRKHTPSFIREEIDLETVKLK